MNVLQRREKIASILKEAAQAVSASSLANQLQVSRQIIVGDVALLRAKGLDILSTPKGYMINPALADSNITFTIACAHSAALTRAEIYAIVDNGATLMDVIVEHPVYGQLVGQLNLSSRHDTDDFLRTVASAGASLLSDLTGGIHLHTISCKDEETKHRIQSALQQLHILLNENET